MQIEMKGIDKSFGTNQVLKDAGFVLGHGEVHALMGENGAGKSTLMKILTGVYTKDKGTVVVDGQEVSYKNPQEAEKAGIVFIHQELNVLFDLTVEENLFMGKEIKNKFGFCDQKAMRQKASEALGRLGVKIDPGEVMSNLSVGQQQMIEICKALMVDAKVIIMDEPTAALTQSETVVLFEVIKSLRKSGVSIVYISHRMEEIFELCDRISVLRDGTYVGTRNIPETNMNDIVKLMIGREIGERYPERDCEIGETVLKVSGLTKKGVFENVEFDVKAGEVLGVSGLMGAGRTETARALFGADPKEGGDIYVNGQKVEIKTPQDAVKCGIGYLSEDRKRYGIVVQKTVAENSTMATLENYMSGLFINKKQEKETAQQYVDLLKTKTPGVDQLVVNLSGGNQQKVVIAKWLVRNCDILIFDEPTRGIDVGAKSEIYHLMNELVAQGKSIIMISSEMTEILRMSDRIVVMCEGRKTGELDIAEATQERIMHAATLRD